MTERDEALRLARDVVALNGEGARGDVALSIAEALLAEHARAEAMQGVVEAAEAMHNQVPFSPRWAAKLGLLRAAIKRRGVAVGPPVSGPRRSGEGSGER